MPDLRTLATLLITGALTMTTAIDDAHADLELATPWPAAADLHGVWGTGKQVFAVGDHGTILRTSDDGRSWQRLRSGSTAALYAIWGAGAEIYVAADANRVLHSHDGGATWRATDLPSGTRTAIYAVWGSGPDDVYAAGVNGVLVHTADHGKSWRSLNPTGAFGHPTLYGVAGTTKRADMYAVGGSGAYWQRSHGTWYGGGGGGGAGLRAIAAVGPEYLAVGEAGRMMWIDATGHPRDARPLTDRILRGVFAHGRLAIAVGETAHWKPANAARATLLRSTDGGKRWTAVDSASDHHLSAVWGDDHALWAVGEAGVIVRSTDRGATWHAVHRRALADAPVTGFAVAGPVVVAASAGGLARSADHGKTWRAVATGFAARVVAVAGGFVAIGDAGGPMKVTRSSDGARWQPLGTIAPRYLALHAVAAAARTVIAVGDDAAIARSADAGATWKVAHQGRGALRGVWHADGAWWIAGDRGVLLRSRDDGVTWAAVTSPGASLDLRAGWSHGRTIVIAAVEVPRGRGDVGPSRGVIARSTDGGATWTTTTPANHYQLAAIAAAGSTLVVTGDHGGALRSSDAGRSWRAIAVPTRGTSEAAWTDGKTLLIGGAHGEIWRGR